MTTRKLIRPKLGRGVHADGRLRTDRRRTPPPGTTHAETSYLHQAIENRGSFVASLGGGREVRGRLEFYDRKCLKIVPAAGTPVLLRKDQVNYYWMEPGAREQG